MYKGHIDKAKTGKVWGWEVGISGEGESGGEKMNNKKIKIKNNNLKNYRNIEKQQQGKIEY